MQCTHKFNALQSLPTGSLPWGEAGQAEQALIPQASNAGGSPAQCAENAEEILSLALGPAELQDWERWTKDFMVFSF